MNASHPFEPTAMNAIAPWHQAGHLRL